MSFKVLKSGLAKAMRCGAAAATTAALVATVAVAQESQVWELKVSDTQKKEAADAGRKYINVASETLGG